MKLSLSIILGCITALNMGLAIANPCDLTISSNDMMQFDKAEMSVPVSCKTVTLTLKHSGKLAKSVMGHNWVLSKSSDMQALANDAMKAGLDKNYVPENDARVLASTVIIGGGETTKISFSTEKLSPSESYQYFCSFPGHWAIMKGSFKITQ